MGNSSNKRDRSCSSDTECPSPPFKDDKFFEFGSKQLFNQSSIEETEETPFKEKRDEIRPRASTASGILRSKSKYPTVFKWDGGGEEVLLSGTFSNWMPIPMAKSQDEFSIIIEVPQGNHQYKFLVDGEWIHASNQPCVDNDMGTKNNVLSVKKSDFEVLEALAMDSISSPKRSASSLPEPYSQLIPSYVEKSIVPPPLPPYLTHVILNQTLKSSSEPTLLPEPSHVMLNHVYTLSMKEGVMVLSTTIRFKKKYVTTLVYKPV